MAKSVVEMRHEREVRTRIVVLPEPRENHRAMQKVGGTIRLYPGLAG